MNDFQDEFLEEQLNYKERKQKLKTRARVENAAYAFIILVMTMLLCLFGLFLYWALGTIS